MNETDSSKPSGRQPTPPPEPTPNWSASEPSSPDADGSLEEEYVRQIESLSRLVAESAMAEIDRHAWVDLKAVKSVRFQPGNYEITPPGPDDPEPVVYLTWLAGSLHLSEAIQRTEENTLVLTLPTVRTPLGWTVPPPAEGQIPPDPGPLSDRARMIPYQTEEWEVAHHRRAEAWRAHLEEWISAAETARDELLERAQADDEKLGYEAMRLVQARRRDPKTKPRETILTELEILAVQFRSRPSVTNEQNDEEILD